MSMVKHKRGRLYTLDVQQEAELMALVNKSDEDIDYSDIPASGSEAWSDAKRGNFFARSRYSRAIKLSGGEHVVLFPPTAK
ncbi:hypothetical protein [Escherichia sp. E4385]|uniref:hypothetical protein n=1 Tax=Escherichia sp. E4385 TaxID=2040639 RepID=UPI001F112F21|nr:hypothetical protein [Escherichia sp. E4385]